MNLSNSRLPRPRLLLLIGAGLVAIVALYGAQRGSGSSPQQVAQVGAGFPLPVYVVNDTSLPDDFTPGSTWKFTTWTVPNSMSWVARVEKVSGNWALLNVQETEAVSSGWYYLPQMPGRWQKQ